MTTTISKEKTLQIGDTLFVDAYKVGAAKSFLTRRVVPKVQSVISLYDSLGALPTFSQKLWQEILQTGNTTPIEVLYMAAIKKEISVVPVLRDTQMKAVKEQMQQIQIAYIAAREALHDNTDPMQLPFTLDVINISKTGEPFVNEQLIVERFSIVLQNEKQLEFYQLAQKMVELGGQMQTLLQGCGLFGKSNWISDTQTHGVFDTDVNNTLTANPVFINAIK